MSTSPTERRWRSVHLLLAGILGLLLVLAVLMAGLLRQSLLQPAVRQMAEPLARTLREIDARGPDARVLPEDWRQRGSRPGDGGGWPAPMAEALARQLRADLGREVVVERAAAGELRLWLQTARGDWLGVPVKSLRGGWARFALVLGGLALLLGVALAILLARRLAAPVERLAAVAARLPEPVDPAAFRVGGPAEVALLGDTLAAALARMAQQRRDQDRLLAALSHDLRTPLMRLLLRVDLLEAVTEADRAALTHEINELDRRIDRFLEDARRGAEEPWAHVDLYAELARLLDESSARGHAWQRDLAPLGPVHAQPGRLQRLLACLVDNAEQHGAAPFRAVLVAESAADGRAGLRLALHNALPSAPRADAGPRRGFGLALAQHVAQGLGGRLEAGHDGTAYGVRLWLPRA